MTKLKTYKDSKEFPLFNYERIESVGDFFYMIKGYEAGDEVEAEESEMKELYNSVVQDYVVSLNSKNYDIVQYGKINFAVKELIIYSLAAEILHLKIRQNEYLENPDNENIINLLKNLKIQKSDNLEKQLDIILRKIDKLKNDISEAEKKIEKNEPKEKQGESDINEMITNVELILERGIDMQKTSLYRFGIMQEQARKKIDQQVKMQK